MNLRPIFKTAQKALSDHAPTILSGLAVTGVITMAAFTGKATFKAAEIIREEKLMRAATPPDEKKIITTLEDLSWQEKVKLVWPQYIPAAATGVLTVACIIGANRISMKRAAALASAFTFVQQNFEAYKDKVVEKLGEEKEAEVRQEVAQERVNMAPPPARLHVVGKQCHVLDTYTGRYFVCTPEILKEAEIKIGLDIIHNGYATLSDFYNLLGLSHTSVSDEVGWNTDNMFELLLDTAIDPDTSQPVLAIDFRVKPIRDYGSTF